MLTNLELIKKIKNNSARPNSWNNAPGRNLGYYDGSTISFDCWNLIKAIIWDNNIDQNYTVGRCASPDPSTGLADLDGNGIIAACLPNVSSDFSNLDAIPPGAFFLLQGGGHAGLYIGNGKCLESTVSWGANGVTYSDVSTTGVRSHNGSVSSSWVSWGIMPWIEYTNTLIPGDYYVKVRASDLENLANLVRYKSGAAAPYDSPLFHWPNDINDKILGL